MIIVGLGGSESNARSASRTVRSSTTCSLPCAWGLDPRTFYPTLLTRAAPRTYEFIEFIESRRQPPRQGIPDQDKSSAWMIRPPHLEARSASLSAQAMLSFGLVPSGVLAVHGNPVVDPHGMTSFTGVGRGLSAHEEVLTVTELDADDQLQVREQPIIHIDGVVSVMQAAHLALPSLAPIGTVTPSVARLP